MSRILLSVSNELIAWAAKGECTVTGYDATKTTAVTVVAECGLVGVQGWDAYFIEGLIAAGAKGTATITGYTATAIIEGAPEAQVAVAQVGSCSITGWIASQAETVAECGTCTVNGYPASIKEGSGNDRSLNQRWEMYHHNPHYKRNYAYNYWRIPGR